MEGLGDLTSHLERLKESFLWAAARGGREEECESLLEMGADVNWTHQNGDSVLIAACKAGHSQVALLLITMGADVDAADAGGQTALHVAANRGDDDLAVLLVQSGASMDAADGSGKGAIAIADDRGHERLSAKLRSMQRRADARVPLDEVEAEERRLGSLALSDNKSDGGSASGGGGSLRSTATSRAKKERKRQRDGGSRRPSGDKAHPQRLPSLDRRQGQAPPVPTADATQDLAKQAAVLHQVVLEERAAKAAADEQVKEVREECARLWTERCSVLAQNETLERHIQTIDQQLRRSRGEHLEGMGLEDLRDLERRVSGSLERIRKRREEVEDEIRKQQKENQNLCVVCIENTKNVLLLPCRHLCVCEECSKRPELKRQGCPLCRSPIDECMNVFA